MTKTCSENLSDMRKLGEELAKQMLILGSKITCQDWEQEEKSSEEGWINFWMILSVEQTIESQNEFVLVKKYDAMVFGKWRETEKVEIKSKSIRTVKLSPEKSKGWFGNLIPSWSSRNNFYLNGSFMVRSND